MSGTTGAAKSATTLTSPATDHPTVPATVTNSVSELVQIIDRLCASNEKLVEMVLELNKTPVYRPPVVEKIPAHSDISWSREPLHLTEDAEDAVHAYEAGLINKGQLEETLKMAGFHNATIDLT